MYKKGSVGSGFNTAAGALSRVSVSQPDNTGKAVEPIPGVFLSIRCDGRSVRTVDLPVTRDLISRFFCLYEASSKLPVISHNGIHIELDTHFDLPLSQGFGMSGAGLISQVLALNRLFDSPFSREECFRMAHHSEIVHGTGLGDISAQSVGGFTIREREGLPPYGKIHGFPVTNKLILAVFGSDLHTKNIILNETKRFSINRYSEGMIEQLLARLPSRSCDDQLFDPSSIGPLLAEMTSLAYRFAQDTGLIDPEIRELCREINKMVSPGSSMCMLGNSIFVIFHQGTSTKDGLYKKVKGILQEKGETFETAISPSGAKVL